MRADQSEHDDRHSNIFVIVTRLDRHNIFAPGSPPEAPATDLAFMGASKKAAKEARHARADALVTRPLGSDLARVRSMLRRLRALDGPQAALNGDGASARNMWIVKPGAKSRGRSAGMLDRMFDRKFDRMFRGIRSFLDLSKLLRYVHQPLRTPVSSDINQWVVQKYASLCMDHMHVWM